MIQKKCTCCGLEKPATREFFSPRAEGRLKLASACRACAARKRAEKMLDPVARAKALASGSASSKRKYHSDPEYRERERIRLKELKRRQRADPEKKEHLLAKDRVWRKANWDRVRLYKHKSGALQAYHVMRRHAAKLRATPAWADVDAIKAVYAAARRLTEETGIEHHVDHIYPLRGRTVCGLHVHTNMQILTATENKRKSNRFLPELESILNQTNKPPSGGFSFLEDTQCPAIF